MQKSNILAKASENLDMAAVARVAQKAVLDEINLVDAQISRDPLISSPEALTLEHRCSTKILQSSFSSLFNVLQNDKTLILICQISVFSIEKDIVGSVG